MSAFRVVDVTRGAPGLARRLDSPLVGRAEELERLRHALADAVARSTCRLVTVVGDAGIGKTRLVGELVSTVDGATRTLRGRCLPYGEGITFWPIAEIVREAAGIFETDPPDVAGSRIRDIVVQSREEALDDIVDPVLAIAGAAEGAGDLQQTFWAVRRFLESLAGGGALIVIVEDIHWAEPTLLDLLQYVAGFSHGYPLLLLCTARPEIRELRPEPIDGAELVVLQPLS